MPDAPATSIIPDPGMTGAPMPEPLDNVTIIVIPVPGSAVVTTSDLIGTLANAFEPTATQTITPDAPAVLTTVLN